MADQRLQRFFGLGLCLSILCVHSVGSAAGQESESLLPSINLVDAVFVNRGGLANVDGDLKLTFEFSNSTTSDIAFQPARFQIVCDDESFACRFSFREKSVTLNPNQTITVATSSRIKTAELGEPSLSLTYEGSDFKQQLNKSFRSYAEFTIKRCGPGDQLAIIDTNMNVCPILAWVLNDRLVDWKQQGIRRVVIDSSGKRDRSSDYSQSSVQSWLASIRKSATATRPQLQVGLTPNAVFEEFFVVVKNGYTPRRAFPTYSNRTQTPVFQATRSAAVSAALKDIYENVPMETVMADLQHEELGLRMLAINQHIDRMTSEQLSQLMTATDRQDDNMQILLASNLHRVALPEGVRELQKLVKSERPAVSAAALTSILKSSSPAAVECVRNLWNAPGGLVTQQKMAEAILKNKSSTHIELLEEYAISLLNEFAAGEAKPGTTTLLTRLLSSLQSNGRQDIIPVAEGIVLKVENLEIQDQLMAFLTSQTQGAGKLSLVREYVRRRMDNIQQAVDKCLADAEPDQPNWKKASGLKTQNEKELGVSQSYLRHVQRVPSADYTQALGIIAASQMSSSTRRLALATAIKCANDEQLTDLAQSFHAIDKNSRPDFLKALADLNHSAFQPLLQECLKGNDPNDIRAVSQFLAKKPQVPQDIVLMFAERLNELLEEQNAYYDGLSDKEKRKLESTERRLTAKQRSLVSPIIGHLKLYSHPEVLRVLNRCERSGYEEIHEIIAKNSRSSRMIDLHIDELRSAYLLRAEEKYQEARDIYDDIIKRNPMLAPAYASRSSLHLRLGEPEKARADLKRCLELDPENATNESLAALAEIQLGNHEQGLQELKRINNSLPDIPTEVKTNAIYNLACGYGRAIEQETSEDTIARYRKLGIKALRDSIERENGFNEEPHLMMDPDLNAFHSHPDWEELRALVKANGA